MLFEPEVEEGPPVRDTQDSEFSTLNEEDWRRIVTSSLDDQEAFPFTHQSFTDLSSRRLERRSIIMCDRPARFRPEDGVDSCYCSLKGNNFI